MTPRARAELTAAMTSSGSSVRTNRTEDDIGEYANALNGKDEEGGTQNSVAKNRSSDRATPNSIALVVRLLAACSSAAAVTRKITGHV